MRWMVRWILFFAASCGWLGRYAALTWGRNAARMHCGKLIIRCRECDALGDVLLGLVQAFMWSFVWHVPSMETSLQTRCIPSWQSYSLMEMASSSRIMHPANLHELFGNGLRKIMKFNVFPWHPNYPGVNAIQHVWNVLESQVQSVVGPPHNL